MDELLMRVNVKTERSGSCSIVGEFLTKHTVTRKDCEDAAKDLKEDPDYSDVGNVWYATTRKEVTLQISATMFRKIKVFDVIRCKVEVVGSDLEVV